MFDLLNEVAILGTTFLMMAIGSIWYSTMAFGSVWMKSVGITESEQEKTLSQVWGKMLVTFLGYGLSLTLLAFSIIFAPKFGLTPFELSMYITVGYAAFLAPSVAWEEKTFSYYFVTVGFSAVFIVGGTLVLQYWPW